MIERTRGARLKSGHSQEEVAKALGINQSSYKWYEVRNPIDHKFIPRFCAIVRITETQLFNDAELLNLSLRTPRPVRTPRRKQPKRRAKSAS